MSSRRRGASGRSSSRRDRYGIQTEEEKFDNEVADGYSSSVSRLVANFQGGSAPTPTGGLDPILATPAARHANQEKVSSLNRPGNDDDNNNNEDDDDDDNGDEYAPLSPTRSNGNDQNDIFRDEPDGDDEDDDEDDIDYEMTLQELLYSTSSFNAIVAPVAITMILSALAVVYVNNDETLESGAAAMNDAYAYFDYNNANLSTLQSLALGLANGLIMVTFIGMMTFVIVLLYKYNCMWCLIGYMMFASTSLLGFLGGHLWLVAIQIYQLPVDWLTYIMFLWNFAAVGVLSIFYGKGVPKYIPQAYLIATSVILAWHLSYFDDVMAWTLLFMLALYDLCAVLTPCGPLKALVNLMSQDNAPDMPGLLYEAELPPEARRPGGGPRSNNNSNSNNTSGGQNNTDNAANDPTNGADAVENARSFDPVEDARSETDAPPRLTLPLAVARVYNLPVVDVPAHSRPNLSAPGRRSRTTNRPLLDDTFDGVVIPDDPTPNQLQTDVIVQLPVHGGRIDRIRRNGRTMYLERDRHANPKRVLWVDRQGRVFAESADFGEDENEGKGNNSIRLGLGDFIFYSVLVAKAAEYSFTTFVVCMLVILAGLGGTLVLLSVFHHALPALPISIILGIFFYIVTRIFIEPWIEAILIKPFYV